MIFFPLVNILNVSIILMMIIVFFNYSSAGKSKIVPIQIKLFRKYLNKPLSHKAKNIKRTCKLYYIFY